MDKYIELIAYYGIDWQQTAIANTRYSVVLAVFAIFVGGFIIAILKRRKIVKLMRQVMQIKQQLEKAEKKHEELVIQQKDDGLQIEGLQQQLEKASSTLKQEQEQHESILASKDELFIKAASDKKLEIDEINALLNSKNQLVEQLQAELDGQKEKIAKFTEAQAKIVELEDKSEQTASELSVVKQQLDTELEHKNERDEQIDKLKQAAQTQIDRVLDLEAQLALLKNSRENEEKQQIETLESERLQLEQVRLNEVAKAKAESEKIIQEPESEPEMEIPEVSKETNVEVKTHTAEVVSKKVDLVVEQKPVESKTVVEKPIDSKAKPKPEKEGVIKGVLGWFSSLDDAVAAEPVADEVEKSVDDSKIEDDIEEGQAKNGRNSNPVINKPAPVSAAESVKIEPVIVTKKVTDSVLKVQEEEESDFSGKLAEVADKMDSLQDKLKGYFKKK